MSEQCFGTWSLGPNSNDVGAYVTVYSDGDITISNDDEEGIVLEDEQLDELFEILHEHYHGRQEWEIPELL